MSKIKKLKQEFFDKEAEFIAKMLIEDPKVVFERELQGYDLKMAICKIIAILQQKTDKKSLFKQNIKKAYFDTKSKEIRIPLQEILPTCPAIGTNTLNIEITLTMEDLRYLVLKCQELNPKIRSCEFYWKNR